MPKRFSPFFLCAAIVLSLLPIRSQAQLSFSSPAGTTVMSSSPEYAEEVLQNPWDFDSRKDLGDFVQSADTSGNITITGGRLSAPPASFFHLLSPPLCGAIPSGKTGPKYYIDTTRYHYLTLRVYSPAPDVLNIVVMTGCEYFLDFWRTDSIYLSPGWHTYTVDMRTVPRSTGIATPWEAVPATGLRIDSGFGGNTTMIDWIRLSGDGGESVTESFSFPAGISTNHFSIFLDDDTNPLNGHERALALLGDSSSSATFSSRHLRAGVNYRLVGIESNDFPTLLADPWDMRETTDIKEVNSGGISLAADGVLFTPLAANATFDLAFHNAQLPASSFRYMRLDLTAAQNTAVFVRYAASTGVHTAASFAAAAGRHSYDLDLAASPEWAGDISRLLVGVAETTALTIHNVSLRNDSFGPPDTSPTTRVAPRIFNVNAPPRILITQPDAAGGADFAASELGNPWNMDDVEDFVRLFGVTSPRILPNAVVDGVAGNFYAASNSEGDPDPHQESLNTNDRPVTPLDASRYRNLVYRLAINRPQDVVLGSVIRLVWRVSSEGLMSFYNSDDIVSFNGWNTYIHDMPTMRLEPLQHPAGSYPDTPWYGQLSHLRVDPHEFTPATEFFFDYIRVTADDEANSQFLISVDVTDADSNPASVTTSLYYTTSATASGGTLIGSFTSNQPHHIVWDTSSVPDGEYYIYALASDGTTSSSRVSTGRIKIDHSRPQDTTDPVLHIDNPSPNTSLYNTFVLTGYALDEVQLAKIDVLVDGIWRRSTVTGLFDPRAQEQHRTFAESGNAGFRAVISLAGISAGNHTLEIRAWDTAGNMTSSGAIPFTKVAGADPAPFPSPTPGNLPPIVVPKHTAVPNTPPGSKLRLTAKTTPKKGQLALAITRGDGCSALALYATTQQNLTDLSRMTFLGSTTGATSLRLQASKLKPFVPKKGDGLNIVATCDGVIKRKRAISVARFPGKRVKKSSRWLVALSRSITQ
jgi:hypothetical protein